jgi:hypothetical protein
MFMNLAIFIVFLGTIYVYINKYCTQTSATQCSNDFMRSFVNVAMYLAKLAVKILSAVLTIVRENPYNGNGVGSGVGSGVGEVAATPPPALAKTASAPSAATK